jgi:hypothetical protein
MPHSMTMTTSVGRVTSNNLVPRPGAKRAFGGSAISIVM